MTDFSDRPFVAGSLVGLRAFAVDRLGRLTGPSFGGVFRPGENVAQCGGSNATLAAIHQATRDVARAVARFTVTYNGQAYPASLSGPPSEPSTPKPHVTAGVDCACGYYAYFDGTNTYAQPDRVAAIIEGYGVCTVGDRGFRAEKARLLAIVDPSMRRWWQTWRFNALIAVVFAALLTKDLIAGEWLIAALDGVTTGLNVALAVWSLRADRKVAPQLALVRRNYPDVPRYRTARAAMKAHPLTKPEPITPETADDFWERGVSC